MASMKNIAFDPMKYMGDPKTFDGVHISWVFPSAACNKSFITYLETNNIIYTVFDLIPTKIWSEYNE